MDGGIWTLPLLKRFTQLYIELSAKFVPGRLTDGERQFCGFEVGSEWIANHIRLGVRQHVGICGQVEAVRWCPVEFRRGEQGDIILQIYLGYPNRCASNLAIDTGDSDVSTIRNAMKSRNDAGKSTNTKASQGPVPRSMLTVASLDEVNVLIISTIALGMERDRRADYRE
jgi:hypothetical protein